jgi:hypothetical protein
MSLHTIADASAVACSACKRLHSRVRSTASAAMRRGMPRSYSTCAAGGSQATKGMRTTKSPRAAAAALSEPHHCRSP